MSAFRIRTAALTVAASIGLSACMTTPYGSGVSVGYGNGGYGGYGGYGGGYGYGAYPGYGYASGYGYDPYWGWHDGYYYPGSGYYVYDQYRNAYPWDRYQDYWEGRRENAMSSREFRRQMEAQRVDVNQQNWSAFDKAPSQVQQVQRVRRSDSRANRIERSNRSARSERTSTSSSSRSSRSSGSERQSASDFRRTQEANRNEN